MDLKNKKVLVIVESPNKVSHIKEYLKDAGYKKVTVVASVGHISNLKDNRSSYKNSGVHPDEAFKLDIAVTDDKKEVVKNLKTQVTAADYVFLMTDGDREGAQIAWSLIQFLKIPKDKYFRAVTHEITPKAVVYAIEHPIQLEENLIQAAQTRMAVDKLVGYSLSPVAKTYIGAKSVGRCQSAGLKIVCDREKEIQDFKPETYYDLYLNFSKNNTDYRAKYVGTDEKAIQHLDSLAAVKNVKNDCNSDFIVKDISKKEKHESPKPPFCTATFQQEAAGKLGLKLKDAMSIAQKLFENGYITYHRTDDATLSEEFIPNLKSFIESTYGNVFTTPRSGKKSENAQEGHEALRVTDINLTPELAKDKIVNDLQCKVYNMIWRRTVACAMPNATISETTYSIYNNMHKFNMVSNEIVDPGYRKVYDYDIEADSEKAIAKDAFKKNEKLEDCSLAEEKKQTTPPPRYTEATLNKELERLEIGRPSTYATIVDTILSTARGYCTLEDKKIVPTERGMQLSAFLDRSFSNIINLNYTKEMESDLDKIANGKLDKLEFLQLFFENLEDAIAANKETGPKVDNTKICPNCGAPMVVRRSRFGKLFYGCTNYPKCHGILNAD